MLPCCCPLWAGRCGQPGTLGHREDKQCHPTKEEQAHLAATGWGGHATFSRLLIVCMFFSNVVKSRVQMVFGRILPPLTSVEN